MKRAFRNGDLKILGGHVHLADDSFVGGGETKNVLKVYLLNETAFLIYVVLIFQEIRRAISAQIKRLWTRTISSNPVKSSACLMTTLTTTCICNFTLGSIFKNNKHFDLK